MSAKTRVLEIEAKDLQGGDVIISDGPRLTVTWDAESHGATDSDGEPIVRFGTVELGMMYLWESKSIRVERETEVEDYPVGTVLQGSTRSLAIRLEDGTWMWSTGSRSIFNDKDMRDFVEQGVHTVVYEPK